MSFLLGTRASDLAMTQSGLVRDWLRTQGLEVDLCEVTTQGDVDHTPLSQLGGIGVFAAALRTRLLDGSVHLAVHSFKDLPTPPVPGLVIAAVPTRECPDDALVARDGLTLNDLPTGARVGTGSPRRAAQLRARRPDLSIVDIRGNVPTRMNRAIGPDADLDAVVLATAGLARLALTDAITEILDFAWAPAQGCLAVETSAGIPTVLADALRAIHDDDAARAAYAERGVLEGLEAGCAAPVGTRLVDDTLTAWVFSTDGRRHVTASATLPAEARHCRDCGLDLARHLLAQGAGEICDLHATQAWRA